MYPSWNGRGGGLVGWALSQWLLILPWPAAWLLAVAWFLAAAWFLWRSLPHSWTGGPEAAVVRVLRDLREHLRPESHAGRRTPDAGRRPSLLHIFRPGWTGRLFDGVRDLLRNMRPDATWESGKVTGGGLVRRDEREKRSGAAPQRQAAPGPSSSQVSSQPRGRAPASPETPREANKPGAASQAGSRPARRKARPSTLPPLDLLRPDEGQSNGHADVRQRAQILKQTLAEFGVPVEVISIKEGPTITQFGLEPGEIVRELRTGEMIRRRVPVHNIMRLSNDLALALAAPSIRIEAPVPGRPYVGVEVPNAAKTLVSLRSILESREFARVGSPMAVALGRDVSGDPVVADLTRLPHLLIAGATGSGKSVCINAIVCSLLMNNGPESLRLLMVDPKMVELPAYNNIPHLLGHVITDPAEAPGALAWLMLQMDDRYRLFADRGVRNIAEYNRRLGRSRSAEPMPYVVLVVDEMADLMMTTAFDVERQICRLAQMSRATGIHLVLATQRPSVDVITGLIKANFPARVAFAVTSQVDSRVILDTPGAEKLLGRGDMLLMVPESAKMPRIQGCFVSDAEIDRLVSFWKGSGTDGRAVAPAEIPWAGMLDQMEAKDDLLETALKLLQGKASVSTSLLQRQLRIGFPRAARLMERLEEMGVVGPDEGGGRSREVFMQQEESVEAAD